MEFSSTQERGVYARTVPGGAQDSGHGVKGYGIQKKGLQDGRFSRKFGTGAYEVLVDDTGVNHTTVRIEARG